MEQAKIIQQRRNQLVWSRGHSIRNWKF